MFAEKDFTYLRIPVYEQRMGDDTFDKVLKFSLGPVWFKKNKIQKCVESKKCHECVMF